MVEFVDGAPLDVHCQAHELPVEERLRLFLDVCAAVGFAHRNLIVHRDIKPQNVLVTRDGRAKLLDFGISKELVRDDELTMTGSRLMTPLYASPEQVLGEPITTASDVYSIGVMLYQILTGRRPHAHDASDRHRLERAICDEVPLRPSTAVLRPTRDESEERATTGLLRGHTRRELSRRLSGDLDVVVMCALHKDPERRYRSADALADDLRRVIEKRSDRRPRGPRVVPGDALRAAAQGGVGPAGRAGARGRGRDGDLDRVGGARVRGGESGRRSSRTATRR